MQNLRNKKRKGFTLVEIIIVVVIIGILAALIIPRFTDATTNSKHTAALAEHRTLIGQAMAEMGSGKGAAAIKTSLEDMKTEISTIEAVASTTGGSGNTAIKITTKTPKKLNGDAAVGNVDKDAEDTDYAKVITIEIGKP